ncbi:hypothetical protein DFQ27_004747 [Actinomortierella ambigua]|uniref:Uncharacterized protein n=1 Tax=Actinomortierella ambigua TaxID=1343610 RepID=A0A9P6Q148_9FUNG|nr:hypothetical protein DFQ27_004747 [Actinomortierella ambigua]
MPSTDSPGHDAEQRPSILEAFREQGARFVSGVEQFWDGLTFEYNDHIRAGYTRLGVTCLVLQLALNLFNYLAPQCNVVNHLFYPTVLLLRYIHPQPWDDLFMNTVRQLGCADRSDIVAKPVPRALRQLQGYVGRTFKAYVVIGVLHLINRMEYYVPPFTLLSLLAMYAYLRSKSFQQPGLVIVVVTALLGPHIPARVFQVVVVQQFFVNELLQPYLARVQFKAWEERAWFQANDVELLGYGFGAWMVCSVPVVGVAALPLMFATTAVLLSRSCGVMENSGKGLLLDRNGSHSQQQQQRLKLSGGGGGGGEEGGKEMAGEQKQTGRPSSDLARDSVRDVAEGRHPIVLGDWDAFEVKTSSAGAPGKKAFITAPEDHKQSNLDFHVKVKGIKMPITSDQVAHDQRYALEHPPMIDPNFDLPSNPFMPWGDGGGGGFGLGPGLGRFPMMPQPPATFGRPPMPPGAVVPPRPTHPTGAPSQPNTTSPSETQSDEPTAKTSSRESRSTAPLPPQPSVASSAPSMSSSTRTEPSAPPLTSVAPPIIGSDTKAPLGRHPDDASEGGPTTSAPTLSGWHDPKEAKGEEESITATPRALEDLTRYNFSDRKTLETAPSAPPLSEPSTSSSSSLPPLHAGPSSSAMGHHLHLHPHHLHHHFPSHPYYNGQHYGDPRLLPFTPPSSAPPQPPNWPFGPGYGAGNAGGGGPGPSSSASSSTSPSAASMQEWQAWQDRMRAEYQRQWERQQRKMARQLQKDAARQRKAVEERRKAALKVRLQQQKQQLQQQQRLQQLEKWQQKQQQKQQQQQQQQQQRESDQPTTTTTPDPHLQREIEKVAAEIEAIRKELDLQSRSVEEEDNEEEDEEAKDEDDDEDEEDEQVHHHAGEEEYTEDEDDDHHHHGPASRFWGRGGYGHDHGRGHGHGHWGVGRGSWGLRLPRGGGSYGWGRRGWGDRRDPRVEGSSRGGGGGSRRDGWDAQPWSSSPIGSFPGSYDYSRPEGGGDNGAPSSSSASSLPGAGATHPTVSDDLPSSSSSSSSPSSSSSSPQHGEEIPPTPPPKDRRVSPVTLTAQSPVDSAKSESSKLKNKGSASSKPPKKKSSSSWKEQVEASPHLGNPFENGLSDTLSRNISRLEGQINDRMEHAADKWVKRLQLSAIQAGETAINNAMASLPTAIKDSLSNAIGPNASSPSSSSSSARGGTKRR